MTSTVVCRRHTYVDVRDSTRLDGYVMQRCVRCPSAVRFRRKEAS